MENHKRSKSVVSEAINLPTCGDEAFSRLYQTLYVPTESINAYKDAEVWKDFTDIQAIND